MRRSKKWLALFLSTAMLAAGFSNLQVTAYATENTATIQFSDTESNVQKVYTINDELPKAVDISADEYFPEVGDQSFNGNCGYWSSYYHNFTYAYNKKHGIKTTTETSHNPIFGFAFYGRSLESDQFIAMQIGYPTFGTLPLDHYGTNCFSPTKEVWEDAIKHRTAGFDDYKRFGEEDAIITGPDDSSLKQIKMLLANDLIVGIGTLSGKWNIAEVGDGQYKGEAIIDRCDISGLGGHGISFVGYDDDIWVDINHDGQKQNAEFGAFKMVNSWGPNWQNGGFIWVAYDALNSVSQVITSADETRINNAIAAGTLKCKKVNNSDRMSFIWFETVSTLKLREKDTSGCICYLTVNTGSRTEMRMSLTAISKADGTHTTWNFPSLVYDDDDYAWDGTKKATDATMAFDLDNLFEDISADKLDNYTWQATFGDTTNDDHALVVKDVYIATDGVKRYVTNVSQIPLNGNERTYDLKSISSGNTSDLVIEEENKKNVIIYYDNSSFKDVNVHYKDGSGTWTTSPGVQMNVSDAQVGYGYRYVVNMGSASSVTLCFNNGNGSWDNNGEKNYVITKPGCYGIKNGSIAELKEAEDIPVEDITLDKDSVELYEEEQSKVTPTITPMDATDMTVIWKSSDESVATVDNGVITGVKEGSATITATTSNGLSKEVKVTVKVNPNVVKPTKVSVLPMELSLIKGDTYTLNATVEPSNATNKSVKWSSSNEKVVTVTSAGVVTAVAKGSAEITATTSNGLSAKVAITVEEISQDFPAIENGVYFEKPSGWGSTIYAYMWIEKNGTSEKLMGTWPGTKIDKIEGSIYGFSTTATEGDVMIIFNDGTNQTADLKFYENGYYDKNGFVKKVVLNGKVYVKCVDEEGNVLSIKCMTGEVGTRYEVQLSEIEGYTLVTTNTTTEIKYYTKEDITETFVYKSNKVKLTGWQEEDGKWYYYDNDGVVAKSQWKKVGNKYYYFDTEGVMQSSKWINNKYYVKSNGVMAVSEFVDNGRYYVDANGVWVTGSKWLQVDSKWYYIKSGSVQKSKWLKIGSYYYYFDASGVMQSSKWISNKYYVKSNGTMATSEFVANGRYYVDETGAWVTGTKWLKVDNKWYYLKNGVVQVSCWVKVGTKYYYFDASGVMQTSRWISGKYYVKADGSMAVSEWVDNGKYYVGSDGAWVKNP
ncbi:MAG: Ig-like domain-containing protein [Lachnospiraceae bacterium]|nr:Ig-like domain-containing protein [Lachnospiraceae bacterium]